MRLQVADPMPSFGGFGLSGLTKNGHFRRMLEVAEGRGFQPRWVLFDSWYTSTVSRWSCRYWKVTSNSGFPLARE